MKIYCCECGCDIEARLITGAEAYPHRRDLINLPFWKCDHCGNFVGCHHKTNNPTRPLGCIPGAEMKEVRKQIHRLIDPAWQSGRISRNVLYNELSKVLGREYHTADLRTIEEADAIFWAARQVINSRPHCPAFPKI